MRTIALPWEISLNCFKCTLPKTSHFIMLSKTLSFALKAEVPTFRTCGSCFSASLRVFATFFKTLAFLSFSSSTASLKSEFCNINYKKDVHCTILKKWCLYGILQ